MTEPAGGLQPIFELGGPAYTIMQRIGIIKGAGPSVLRRSIAFIAVAWLPMLVFAVWQGNAIGPTPRASLLLDFASYARFFLAVPLIFAAEAVVGPRMLGAGRRFVESGLVRPADIPTFIAAAERIRRRRDAVLPEAVFAIAALVGAWFITIEQLGGLDARTWHAVWTDSGSLPSLAGVWYNFVAIPLVQFFLFRWLWRLVIWTLFLVDLSRIGLNLFATHADRAGGLGFLGAAHVTLAIFPLALSCVIAAETAFRIRFEGLDLATLRSMLPLLAAYMVLMELVTFGPLVVLVPLLIRVRREGLRSYGMLTQHHNHLFHEKWILKQQGRDNVPLGDPDISSLADMGTSYDVVRHMQTIPVSRSHLLQVAAIASLPGLPLLLMLFPVAEVLRLLLSIVG